MHMTTETKMAAGCTSPSVVALLFHSQTLRMMNRTLTTAHIQRKVSPPNRNANQKHEKATNDSNASATNTHRIRGA